ncbi:MAG: hypothetical protein FWE36_07995 [Erysipelotrichales bacterium]|nr:hypothetical protein [Erysipelotrichales bacterium]
MQNEAHEFYEGSKGTKTALFIIVVFAYFILAYAVILFVLSLFLSGDFFDYVNFGANEFLQIILILSLAISITIYLLKSKTINTYVIITSKDMVFHSKEIKLEKEKIELKEYKIVKSKRQFSEFEVIFSDGQSIRITTKRAMEFKANLDRIIQTNTEN